jgi:putative nucleotidyltransferase with HDIG domain
VKPTLGHLARRFLGVWRARPLLPAEQAAVARLLGREEAALFWCQPVCDQRHGFECAARVLGLAPSREDLAAAALLHDVGKRHAGLGAVGRALATGAGMLRLPVSRRGAAYRNHAASGAADLAAAGAPPAVVAFARSHHGPRPADITPGDWDLLCATDRA